MQAIFHDDQLSQASSDATALHHTLESWQRATSGMLITRCMDCSALVYIMPSGTVSGGAITLQCSKDLPSAQGQAMLLNMQRNVQNAPKKPRPTFHAASDLAPESAPCEHCGNRSTLQSRGCRYCSANSDLAEKTKPKKRNVPSSPQDYVVAHLLLLTHDDERVRYKSMQTAIGKYTAPCGVVCNARALYMPEDYYGIGMPKRIIATYNCGCSAPDCYRILAPDEVT